MTLPGQSDFDTAMAQTVAELNEKIATCHERRACPRCGAELGERCHNLTRVSSSTRTWPVKNPHRERWSQEVPVR